jgi:hypothetical protein
MTATRTEAAPISDTSGSTAVSGGGAGSLFFLGLPGAWIMVSVFAVVDLIWSECIGLSIAGWGAAAGLIGLLLAVSAAYRRRSRAIAMMIETGALWIAFTGSGCVLTYLAATCTWPLQDTVLRGFDDGIGFDWLVWRNAVLARPVLHLMLSVAYASLLPQMALSALFFAATDRAGRSTELLTLAALTLVPTLLISIFCPALGPFGTYPGADATFLPDLLALRGIGPWHFELRALEGLIQMPSYHVVLAVLFTYTFRRTGPVGWGVAGLNALMLPAIPPLGGHYFVDMIVGGAIAVLGILVWRWWHPGGRATADNTPERR